MQVEIGKIYEGTIKNITKYGAFVEMHLSGDSAHPMGMVHISEISRSYVREIRDFVTEGQQVKVKVIGIHPQGKIRLSMKQTEKNADNGGKPIQKERGTRPQGSHPQRSSPPNVYQPKEKTLPSEMTFEDMLSRFKQNSEERMCDIKRGTERKNRSRRK